MGRQAMAVEINRIAPDSGLCASHLPEGTLRALQLTDTHLYADPDGTLLGINTLASFEAVLQMVHAANWQPDLLLATGDLVHDASPNCYRQLADALAVFEVPVFCLPGNHDLPEIMHQHLRNTRVTTAPVHDHGDWRFIMLDSVIPQEPGGHLEQQQLDLLAEALADSQRHTLVCMHHQPVDVGSAWIDTMTLDNPDALFDVLDGHNQVRGLLFGHVHQTFDAMRRQMRLMASPSTCVQFMPHSDEFQVDREPPGFRLLALLPDGTIRSEVLRTADIPRGVELASTGY